MLDIKKNKSIIILSGTDWSDNKVSIMHIAEILSKNNNVFFVQTFGRRFPKITELKRIILRFKKKKLVKRLKIISLIAIPFSRFYILNILNAFLINLQLKKITQNNHFKLNVIVSSPIWYDYVNKNKFIFDNIIFHCVDNLLTYSNFKIFKKNFYKLKSISTKIITPNELINKEFFDNKAIILTNSVNFKCQSPINKNYNIKKNIIYSGTLANWVDYDLLNYLTLELKDFNFFFIGYIHPLVKQNKLKFLSYKNVNFIGKVEYSDLSKFYLNSHIGVIPYIHTNRHIYYSSPTKVHDYLFFKLKIVSVEIPYIKQIQRYYPSDIRIENKHEKFRDAIYKYSKEEFSSNANKLDDNWEAREELINKLF